MEELDSLLHQPLRTQLVAFLAGAGEQTFSDLKRQLGVSDGNLDAHLKKLLAADYVAVRKETGNGRPQSFFVLTPGGLSALQTYVQALHRLLPISPETSNASGLGEPKLAG
ncbi:MAG: ArsR family transcriptional regulator [Betaproteobacteria bacterium HGW-Betaproteobacteria-4]|jgi:predicted ArsR family transcriptional regulator|nr:MAG: ArsR family transcriptional regulator [Betaproteobacteria bacterium HGW-Betaproteobacteria-4]